MDYLTFNNLAFTKHPNSAFKDCEGIQAVLLFNNGYGVSVVTAKAGSGLYGDIEENTFEIAAIRGTSLSWELVYPENTSFKDDVCGYKTPEEITELMKELQDLK